MYEMMKSLGYKINIKKILEYKHDNFMKPYIDFLFEKKSYYKSNGDIGMSNTFKILGNCLFGVAMTRCEKFKFFFSIFPHGEKWKKKYMEREGKVFISLSFHILFSPFFPMGKNGKTHIFPWAKMGLDPPPPRTLILNNNSKILVLRYSKTVKLYQKPKSLAVWVGETRLFFPFQKL